MKSTHETIYARESTHELVPDVQLRDGAGLYRFTNCNGAECSSIWQGDEEVCWHYRDKEQDIIDFWNGKGRR